MRHRLINSIGFGNPSPVLLDNKGKINNDFAMDALRTYFSKEFGFDFNITKNEIAIGIEPAYQYERLKIISINKDKSKSYIQTGKAWGPYGSQIAKNTKTYKEYKNKSKFVKFIDKWHPILFGS